MSTVPGYLYVMRSASLPIGWYKIGMSKNPNSRATQLGGTGSPFPYYLVKTWWVNDMRQAERLTFHYLDRYRVRADREFFDAKLSRICSVAEEVRLQINFGKTPDPAKIFENVDLSEMDSTLTDD